MDYDESFFSAMEIKNNPHLKISLYVHLGTMNGARAGNVQCVRQGFDVLLVRLVSRECIGWREGGALRKRRRPYSGPNVHGTRDEAGAPAHGGAAKGGRGVVASIA